MVRGAPEPSCFRNPGSRPVLPRSPGIPLKYPWLLQFNLGAGLLELGLDLLGLVLVHAFLDSLGGAFDEVLGFLEAQAGDGADFLDDFDLLLAGGDKHYRELGLS